ncbi:ATP-binding cassette domain-containing protein [Actinokineospora sp. G85]|uniref:ATP-binding cassette domain-containing protein n=1 Tax=Actinokineospora sp. G85 TaxID=3406626 RepID=UPI003C76B343
MRGFRWVLLGVPVLLALFGPLFVDEGPRGVAFGEVGPLGEDFVGRDVLAQVVLGGQSVVLIALGATAVAYGIGVPWGLGAALARRRWVDEVVMRPLDLLLALPSLLVLLVVAGLGGGGVGVLVVVVAVVMAPEVVRVVRAAALPAATGHVVEAMRQQGEGWWRTAAYVGRTALTTLVADVGVRLTSSVYLVASAAFLGVGLAPDASDWAVMVDRNQVGLAISPWAVVVPALLLVALSVGINLVLDGRVAQARPVRDVPAGETTRVTGLTVTVAGRRLVDDVSFEVAPGRVLALVGESGSGKTTTALALLGEAPGEVEGQVRVGGRVAFVPQHPSTALNPVRRIGPVLDEVARVHGTDPAAALAAVGLPADRAFRRRLPHQLSGGQQQRLVLAHALLTDPALVVADEPTTGQDPHHRGEIADRLRELAARGSAVLLLSHDLDLVRDLADAVLVLDGGRVVGSALPAPQPGPAPRATPTGDPVLRVDGLRVAHRRTPVLDGVTLDLRRDECVAVTGRSGQGKTTLARALAGLHRPEAGEITAHGRVHYVFQDARQSFDDRRPVLDQVARTAVRLRGLPTPRARAEAVSLLGALGVAESTAARRPGALSGGELKRAALVRALLAEPAVLVCDEVTAGLDAASKRLVLDLLGARPAALVLVTHDPDAVAHLADRTLDARDGGLHDHDHAQPREGQAHAQPGL